MIGMNEALILEKRKDILDEILLALEAFTDDILPAIGESTFTITPSMSRLDIMMWWKTFGRWRSSPLFMCRCMNRLRERI